MRAGVTAGQGGHHILVTTDAVGGVWSYALDLARGLTERGAAVTFATLGPAPDAGQRAAAASVPGLRLTVTDLPLDWTADRPEAVLAAGAALAALAREARADLVHLHAPALAAGAAFPVPTVAVCHSCLATWWAAVRAPNPLPPDFAWRIDLNARGLRAADALLAPTRAFAEATRRAYALPSAPLVVRNGRRAPEQSGPATRGAYALTAGRLWDEGKGIATLDRAAARLPFPVLAAGPSEGPNGAGIALRHLHAIGRLDEAALGARLAEAAIFVSPALYEPFGLSVLEAAQRGCALVLSDIATFRELWDGAADFVPPGDEAALAAALERAMLDAGYRDVRGAAARERARAYTLDAMAGGVAASHGALLGVTPAREAAA